MSPTESISTVFRNYINFKGRAQRSEYWWFTLFSIVVSVILGIIASVVPVLTFLEWVYSLAVLLPSLAVTVRRLHDTERPAWLLLVYLAIALAWIIGGIVLAVIDGIQNPEVLDADIQESSGFIPYVIICGLISLAGVVTLLVLCALPGTRGPNRYGPDPLQPDMGMSGYGYADPGHPYAPSPLGGTATEVTPEPSGRLYCSQCGAERQPDARFCTVCGAEF